MTIEELKKKMDAIPKTGTINKARRRAIMEMINKIINGEE